MSQFGEPTEPWLSPDASQPPDPAAYLHAPYHPLDEAPSTPLLYPMGPSVPPPPATSPPVYFSMLYPDEPRGGRRGVGLVVGIVVGVLLAAVFGIAIIRGGFFSASSARASAPRPPTTVAPGAGTTLPTETTLPGAANPTPGSQSTPGANPVGTASPQPTSTLAPGVMPTITPVSTATPLPPLTVTITYRPPIDKHNANFAVQTAANASLAISVLYCDGALDTNVATSGTTDSSGYYATTWSPSDKLKGCNTATVTVDAMVGNQRGTGTSTLTFN